MAVTLAAPVVAAGNAPGPWAVLLLVASLAVWLSPAVRRLPGWAVGAFMMFVLSGVLAFLPLAAWVRFPWWRDLGELGVVLPGTITAQPWLTLQGQTTLVAVAAWAWYLLSREWRLPRHLLLQVFGAGALLILSWWVVAAGLGRNLSGVTSQTAFGSFPNRNQSANFAALSGILFAALALHGRLHRRNWWGLWLAALLVALIAVVASGSRAGLLLLALGVGSWFVWMSRAVQLSAPVMILLNGALLAAAGLLAFGGSLLHRFNFTARTGDQLAADFRLLLYRDALPLIGDASWHGIGMGNFAAVFARYRDLSVNESRAIHPDSDWVWMTAELGWLAPLCLGVLIWFAFRQCRPFNEGSDRVLRAAGVVCGAAFLLHSLFDVPGHRATVFPALLLIGLAANPTATLRPAPAALGRIVAAVLTLVAGGQLLALHAGLGVPTSDSVRAAKAALGQDLDRGSWAAAADRATGALAGAPLDWELYFGRASARVMLGADTQPAQRDFAVARYLENNPRVAFDEGVAWLVRESDFVEASRFIGPRPDLAAAAWEQVFTRPLRNAADLYGAMAAFAPRYPEIRPYLRRLAGNDPVRLAVFFRYAAPEEIPEALATLLTASPDLADVPDEQLSRVFAAWAQAGDRDRLVRELPARPRWLAAGWIHLGDALAGRGELRQACDLARAQFVPPELPPIPAESLESLRRAFASQPRDLVAGIRLVQKLSEANQFEEAQSVITALLNLPGSPAYLNWLAADLRERAGDLPGAWAAWRRAAGR